MDALRASTRLIRPAVPVSSDRCTSCFERCEPNSRFEGQEALLTFSQVGIHAVCSQCLEWTSR